jgi:PAS domain S-box-containing protein
MNAKAGSGEVGPGDRAPDGLDPAQAAPPRSRALSRGGLVIGVVLVIAVVLPILAFQFKKTEMLDDLDRRLEILSRGRAEVIGTWLDGMTRPADRVVDSELFRLFATEMDLAGGDISDLAGDGQPKEAPEAGGLGVPLTAQIPFMEQVLTDFTKNAAVAKQVFEGGVLRYGPVRASAAGLVMDVYAPVLPAQSEGGAASPVGVVLLTAPVAAVLAEVLSPPPLAEPGEELKLVQLDGGAFFEIDPGRMPPLRPVEPMEIAAPDRTIPFAGRVALGGGASVYSAGTAVAGPAWWVVQEIDQGAATRKLSGFITGSIVISVLSVLMVAAAFGAFWWRLSNEHNVALADQFQRLAARISAQKSLLDSINNTIAEYIGLKALDGTYRYANPAFARAIGREAGGMVGLDDAAVFGRGTADRLKISDDRAMASGAPITINEDVYIGARLHHLQISKVPHHDESGAISGVISVTRDVTELIEEQKKRERAVEQMVNALVRAVELRDPYLAGHSRRVAGFALAVAQRLGVSAEDVATVEVAANLSQIGKLGVPRDILNKPERLNEAEIEQVQQHLDYAAAVLRDIDFELPVLETVMQMHERLDGGGYPRGLSGERIRLSARILGACDVFCARVEPRSYRGGIPADKAIEILEQNAERYDPAVVAALKEVAGSVAGEKLIAGIAV